MDWIKIVTNILDNVKIKLVRNGPEGDTLALLWILILLEAGKSNQNGYLMLTPQRPYTPQMLSMVTDIPLTTVTLGLNLFEDLEMIDCKDGPIYIVNWSKYQSVDKLEERRLKDRERQQKCRAKKKEQLKLTSHDVSRDVTEQTRPDKSRSDNTTTGGGENADEVDYLRLLMIYPQLFGSKQPAKLSAKKKKEWQKNGGMSDLDRKQLDDARVAERRHKAKAQRKAEEKIAEEAESTRRNLLWRDFLSLDETAQASIREAVIALIPPRNLPFIKTEAALKAEIINYLDRGFQL